LRAGCQWLPWSETPPPVTRQWTWGWGDLDNGIGGSLHQIALVGAQRVAELFGHRDGDVEIAARQHFELARLEPALSLISMTFGTAPVLARMVGIDLGAARITAPEVPAERFGAAGHDVGDGASMRSRHRRAPFATIMSRQIVVRKTAEDVRNLDHGRCLPSQASHQLVEDGF
jgi:hypothetical protein